MRDLGPIENFGIEVLDPQLLMSRYGFGGEAQVRYKKFITRLKKGFLKRFAEVDQVLLCKEEQKLLLKLFQYHMNNVGNPDGQCRYALCTRGFEFKLLNALFNYLNLKPYGKEITSPSPHLHQKEPQRRSGASSFGYFTLGEKEACIWMLRTAKAMMKDREVLLLPSTYSSNLLFQATELLNVKTLKPFDLDQDIQERLKGLEQNAVILCINLNANLNQDEHRGLRHVIRIFRSIIKYSFVHLSCSSAYDLLRFGEGYPLLEADANKYYVYPPLPHHLNFDASGGFYLDTISISNSLYSKSSFKSGVLISTARHKVLFNDESIAYIDAEDSTVVGSSNGDFILIDDYYYTRFPLTSISYMKELNLEDMKHELRSRQLSPYQRSILSDFLEYLEQVQPYSLGYPVNQLWNDHDLNELFLLMIKEKIILNTENEHIQSDFNLVECRDANGNSYIESFVEEVIHFYRQLLFPKDPLAMNGYITTGGTEGNDVGLFLAKQTLGSHAVLFTTQESHYSIKKAARIFGLPICWVKTDEHGVMSVDHLIYSISTLKEQRQRQGLPLKLVINVNVGTTFKGAVDPLQKISKALRKFHLQPNDYWIHGDAALQGHMLPFLDHPEENLPFMLSNKHPDHATLHSISLSAHKFLGAPFPCGVVLYSKEASERAYQNSRLRQDLNISTQTNTPTDYFHHIGTITSGTQNAYMAVVIWKRLKEWGVDGLRAFALNCLALSKLAELRLRSVQHQTGIQVFRHPHSNILLLSPAPSPYVLDKYGLPTEGEGSQQHSHLVVMPHVSIQKVNQLIDDLLSHPPTLKVENEQNKSE